MACAMVPVSLEPIVSARMPKRNAKNGARQHRNGDKRQLLLDRDVHGLGDIDHERAKRDPGHEADVEIEEGRKQRRPMAGFLEVGQFHSRYPFSSISRFDSDWPPRAGRAGVRFQACRSRSRCPRPSPRQRPRRCRGFLANGVENGVGADIHADADLAAGIAAGARRLAGEQRQGHRPRSCAKLFARPGAGDADRRWRNEKRAVDRAVLGRNAAV